MARAESASGSVPLADRGQHVLSQGARPLDSGRTVQGPNVVGVVNVQGVAKAVATRRIPLGRTALWAGQGPALDVVRPNGIRRSVQEDLPLATHNYAGRPNFRLIRDEDPAASIVTYLIPVVAVIFGVFGAFGAFGLSEALTARVLIGVVVVLVGVALAQRHPTHPKDDTDSQREPVRGDS